MSEPEIAAGGGGDGDAPADVARARDMPTSGGERGPAGATRPLVLPEPYDGSGSWSEWSFHFENVAAVNITGTTLRNCSGSTSASLDVPRRRCTDYKDRRI